MNVFGVISGTKSWIGYLDQDVLPTVKKGVLIPSHVLGQGLSKDVADRIDMLYAKDYKLSNDFKIIFKVQVELCTLIN